MPTATQVINQAHRKMLGWGAPKGGGKSTFYMYAPPPIAVLQYDLGNPVIPPGVNGDEIFVKVYPPAAPGFSPSTDRWVRPKNVGSEMIEDIMEIRAAVLGKRPIKLKSEAGEWALPRSIVCDGLVAMGANFIDWILAVNNIKEPDEYTRGKTANSRQFWGKRLDVMSKALNSLVPLPVNIALITWESPIYREEKDGKGDIIQVRTNCLEPDIGGKLDIWGPGKVDASLYHYSRITEKGVRYFVRTKPNAFVSAVGVRGEYALPDEIDVTVTPTQWNPTPWERLWGKESARK